MKNKKLTLPILLLILVSILTLTLASAGCKNDAKTGNAPGEETLKIEGSSTTQDSTASTGIKAESAESTAGSPATESTSQAAAGQQLAGFASREAGFSFEYPSDIVSFSTNQYVNAAGNPMLLSVNIVKLGDIEKQVYQQIDGYEKETSLSDMEALKNGKFGENVDFPFVTSEKVIKIGSSYGKDFIVFGRFDVCDVVFERKLIFYNNDYRIIITLALNKDEIIKSMPDLFGTDKANCGDVLAWKRTGDKSTQDDFYNALITKTASEKAQQWYDTFDSIAAGIKLDTGENPDFSSAGVAFLSLSKFEENKEHNYIIIDAYPEFLKSAAIPEKTAADLNASIINLIQPVSGQFTEDVLSMGPPDSSDTRVYVNSYMGDFSLAYSGADLISILYNVYTFTGGAHGSDIQLSLNYDIAGNREIKLADIFKPDFDYLKFISDYCINDLKKQLAVSGGEPDTTWLNEGAGPKIENLQNFVLTKDALIIKFGQYQVAPYAVGMLNVSIPYSGFKDNINPESPVAKLVGQ